MSNIKVSVQDGNNVTLLVTPQPRIDVRVDKGIAGVSGFSGQSGYSGYSGYSGASGTGASGYSGVSGYSGYSGISGWSGISGFSGYSGISGFSGYSGSGVSGWSGISGFSGYSGISGYSGAVGQSGLSGYSGWSGISGYSGSGISGYSGYSGYSGSGVSGYSGFSGISGFSGYSGISGYSGQPGVGGTIAHWGSFWDTTTQTAASANTPYSITLNSSDPSNYGVSVVSGSRVTFTTTGVYSLTFSIQFTNHSTGLGNTQIWLKKNGTNLADTNSHYDVPDKQGSAYSSEIFTVNFVLSLAANDYIEVFWQTSNTSVYIETLPAAGGYPETPSIIFTATQVTYTQSGYSGFSGYSGISGYSGAVGQSGTSGYSGYSGSGISGYSGYSGISGYSGSGISGYSGYSGIDGASGFSGYSGAQGVSGISGYSGYSGLDGESGFSGYSGYSGSGISGYSGYSGYSGATTYPGAGIAVSTGSAWGTSLTAPSGDIVGTTDAQTLTNKRIDPRVSVTTSASSVTPDISSYDAYYFTAQAATLTINATTGGTPVAGDKLIFQFKDNGTPQTLTWTTSGTNSYRVIGVTLPTTTTAGKVTYVGCIYNATESFWDVVAVTTQA